MVWIMLRELVLLRGAERQRDSRRRATTVDYCWHLRARQLAL